MRTLLRMLVIAAVIYGFYQIRQYAARQRVYTVSHMFVLDTVKQIIKNWKIEDFEKYSDTTLKANKNIADVFANYRKLGAVQGEPDCDLKDFTTYKYQEKDLVYLAANYQCHAVFEKGPATISLTIYHFRDNYEWKIQYFKLDSPYFSGG